MDHDKAASLADELTDTLRAMAEEEWAKSAPWSGGMEAVLDTTGRTLSETRHLMLGESARFRASIADRRLLLELTDGTGDHPAATIRMGAAETMQLVNGLREAAE